MDDSMDPELDDVPDVRDEAEDMLALVVREPQNEIPEVKEKNVSLAAAKARRLACPTWQNTHVWKGKYHGYGKTREQYGRDLDSGDLRGLHRVKLRHLLKRLMEERRWNEACGVVSVLLSIPFQHQKGSPLLQGNRSDYWAAVMLIRRLSKTEAGDKTCRRMLRVLSRKQPNARRRGEIQLESALYLISQGDRTAAYDELRSIADGVTFRDDPVVNLCHGLNTYFLWREAAEQENSQDEGSSRSAGPQEVMAETRTPEPSAGNSEGKYRHAKVESSEGSLFSARPDGRPRLNDSKDTEAEIAWQASQRSIYEDTNEEGFVEEAQVWTNAKVPASLELDRRLFPICVKPTTTERNQQYRVPMNDWKTRDFHTTAVKHLQQALLNAPEMLPALLPLVQLLLAVHDIKGAVEEIDRCASALKNNCAPPSIKALLLESLEHKDYPRLEECYWKVLSSNPFSDWALKGLINMRSKGKLDLRNLLCSIVLHLDATSGSAEVWRKLSSCFLEVAKASIVDTEVPGMIDAAVNGGKSTDTINRRYLQDLWDTPRHQFWLTKHFSSESRERQQQLMKGDSRLAAYKASCAAHLYGPDFETVKRICGFLEMKGEIVLLKFIERHRQNSVMLFAEQYQAPEV